MTHKFLASTCLVTALISTSVFANDFESSQQPRALQQLEQQQNKIEALQQQLDEMRQQLDERMGIMADTLEKQQASGNEHNSVHIGGYGEMHYNALDANGEDVRQLDFHRLVLFFGYEFSEQIRFVTEFEIEHIIASSGSRGAVELEQAYLEFDVRDNMQFRVGAMLMPIGIINETHEPPTFYGVERPTVETRVIPTTWWSNGLSFSHRLNNGLSYDLMISEGLKTQDPNSNSAAQPFNLKLGKQKGSFADAFDLALTGRLRYRGIQGLELAVYAQYQPDLDQSAKKNYADEATLLGGHAIYQWQRLTLKALYTRWNLGGDLAKAADKHVQDGGYLEANWKPNTKWGFFARQSAWSLQAEVKAQQTDLGVNFYPHEKIVVKADYQLQNDDAGNSDGINLGVGYAF